MELGMAAYDGYRTYSNGVSLISGDPIPEWDDQTPEIRAAWRAAADNVMMIYQLGQASPPPAADQDAF